MSTGYVLIKDGDSQHERPFFFKLLALGMFWVCTGDRAEARVFATRAAASRMLTTNGKHREGWRVLSTRALGGSKGDRP